MKIENRTTQPVTIEARDIPTGTVFSGRISTYPEMIFLRGGGENAILVVSLSNPLHHWTSEALVYDYRPLQATLVVG